MHPLSTSGVVVNRRALGRWRNAVIAAFGLGGLTLTAWAPRLPELKAALALDTGTLGTLLAAVTVGSIAGLAASTPVLAWLGSRRALSGALLLVAAALAVLGAAALLTSVPLIAVAFALVGAGIGTLDVLINVEGSAVEQAAGRTLMPLMHGVWSIGVAIGAGIGGGCAALHIAPSVQFFGEAVVVAAAALVMAPSIPAGARVQDAPATERLSRWAKVGAWLRGWTDWRLLLIGVVMLGVELGEGSANNWLTIAVSDAHGRSPAMAAVFFAVFATAEAGARLFGGPVVDRLGRVRAIRCTTALGVLGTALFILGRSPWLVLLGVVLWAVGVSMGFPLGMSAAAESGPNPAARVSVVASIGYLANLAGPPAVGLLAQSAGVLRALWLVAALLTIAFAAAGSLRRRPDPHRA